MKAAMGAVDPTRKTPMTIDRDDDFEPRHNASPTARILDELQLYGYRPFQDEPDPRPLPEAQALAGGIADIFDALVVALADTRLEPDLEELLWSTVNVFHRAIHRIERELDDNELAQQRSQREQDGSEVKSVELERLTVEGQTLIERRNAFELMRDEAADQFERHTAFSLAAAQRIEGQPSPPHRRDDRQPRLSRRQEAREERGASARRAEGGRDRRPRLQRSPADLGQARSGSRQAPRHGAAARRLAQGRRIHRRQMGQPSQGDPDRLQARLDEARQGGPVQAQRRDAGDPADRRPHFPGTGIQDNLADKARKLGIPVWRFGKGGA